LATAWLAVYLSGPANRKDALLDGQPEIEINVALVETGGSHDEVTAALYYAIASVPGAFTSMYLALPRFGIENVYAWIQRRYKLMPYSIFRPYEFQSPDAILPDTIILATCEHDVYVVDTALHHNFESGPKKQTLVCVMHHIDSFKAVEKRVRRWARAGRLRFVTLSPHTSRALRTEIDSFDSSLYAKVAIDTFPPVFPIPLDPNTSGSERLAIAMQGNFEDSRRDYLKTLLEFERMIDELPDPIVQRIHFILAGDGKKVGIPGKVMPYVSVNFSLDYIPYYNLLHESFALIPAFADEAYYKTKASSSIPASFIAGSPVVGSKQLLESYGYLSHESTWHTKSAESSEMAAIYELLRHHFDDNGMERSSWKHVVGEKKRAVRKRALELMAQNTALMREILLKQGSPTKGR
jgi:hypothetical protein